MKRTVGLMLIVCLLLGLAGCAAQKPDTPAVAGEGQVVDGAGVVKNLPAEPQRATIASVYAVSVPFISALGLSDRVLAVNTKSSFWLDADAGLAAAGTVGRGTVDLEALAKFSPDVLLHRSNDPKTVESVEKLGIEVLCITVENLEDIEYTLRMMGSYFGAEQRAGEVIGWMQGKFEMIDDIVAQIPADERVTAMTMGGEPGRVAGADMLQSWLIEKAGGVCVVDVSDNRGWVDAGLETVFKWNPDYIFCTSSTALDYSIDGLLNDDAWSGMTAVQDAHILQLPAKIDSWDMPGISCPLAAMYMLHAMYPAYFSADQLAAEVDEYYQFMFGQTFAHDYLGLQIETTSNEAA